MVWSRPVDSVVVAVAVALAGLSPLPGARAAEPAVYRYEVRGRGNISDLEEFAALAGAAYADRRGWAGDGSIRFQRVVAGGDFTLWLAADAQMASFGGACDVVWSCRSGDDVVVNEDRWLQASPSWIEAGASLRDYRHLLINHETGHWLGLFHSPCSGAGRPAAVMQQQSMDMQGCVPNPWPLAGERRRASQGRRPGGGVPNRPLHTGQPASRWSRVASPWF